MPLTRSSCFYILHPANAGIPPNYKNLAVFGGSYFLLGLLATVFGFSRYVTVKLARQAIPKTYVPITHEDLPKKVYEFVQSELDRVARLAKKATPTLEESAQPGWGKPESSLQDTHFKTFMASTPHFIERAAIAYSPDLARPPNMSISAYVHMLMDQRLVARDLGLEYIAGYEQVRFGGTKNEYSPVSLPVAQHPHHPSHQRQHTKQFSQQQQQQQYAAPRNSSLSHPQHDASILSTTASIHAGHSIVGTGTGAGARTTVEDLKEEDYIRFMKVLSLILQSLGWDQDAEDTYDEECREQERYEKQQQQQRREYELEMMPTSAPTTDRESSFSHSRQDLLGSRGNGPRRASRMSDDSFYPLNR
ncbi:hypothetical protein BGZ94_009042 [Podila epigama]|nr:hypothetical protein BGZ94_009042 [Podila epigama]